MIKFLQIKRWNFIKMANLLFPNIDVYGPKELATDLYTHYQPNISETQFVT